MFVRPTVVIQWFKRSGHLPSTAIVSDFGRRLTILDVGQQDAGVYSCRAFNPVGEVQSSTNLSVVGQESNYKLCYQNYLSIT